MPGSSGKRGRIAIVSDSVFPYNTGGKETRIRELSTRLAAAGYDVHIYTMHWWKEPQRHRLENGVHLHAISPLYPLYSGPHRSTKQGVLFGVACFKLIFAQFDVVDVDHIPFFPLISVRLVAWLKRRPMIATWHEVWGRNYWQDYLGRRGLAAYVIERLSVLLPNKIIAVSEMTKERLLMEMKFNRTTALIHNGIVQDEMKQVRAKGPGSDIIFAGRLIEHKHVDILLQAMALLKKSHPAISAQIFGDGPERRRLEALAGKLNLSDNVMFRGFVPDQREVFAHMKAARVFVLPSTREGFGISVIEAGACGLPVVTVDHPDNAAKNLITPATGRLAKLTAADIAAQINALLSEPPSSRAIRAAVAPYDWDVSARELEAVYAL